MPFVHWLVLIGLLVSLAGCQAHTGNNPDNQNPPSQELIENRGSDTMVNLALAWAEQYQTLHPEVRLSVTGGGSGVGLSALINNTVDIANASRQIKPDERSAAMKNGVEPVEHIVARDAIAIIVHPNNPISQMTLQEISDIYSGKINNWKELGGEDLVIVRLSRETNSGTHVYFLEQVLRAGQKENKTLFATDTLLLPSSEGITAEISDNPHAIGYDGLGYVTPNVKVISVARSPGFPYVLPSAESVNNLSYPIARDLYMYTIGEPKGAIRRYLEWINTPEAQLIVQQLGFVPVIAK
jgi:phosphate transport system substrate-binding protein